MPLYKHTVTGKIAELTERYVRVFDEGTYELVSEETPRQRERREAAERKVDIDAPGEPVTDVTGSASDPHVVSVSDTPEAIAIAASIDAQTGKGKK